MIFELDGLLIRRSLVRVQVGEPNSSKKQKLKPIRKDWFFVVEGLRTPFALLLTVPELGRGRCSETPFTVNSPPPSTAAHRSPRV